MRDETQQTHDTRPVPDGVEVVLPGRSTVRGLAHLGYDGDVAPSLGQTLELRRQSAEWWHRTLKDPEKLNAWLLRLRDTEARAEERFVDFANTYTAPGSRQSVIFTTIAAQERNHGVQITEVLAERGVIVDPTVLYEARYWKHVGDCVVSRETAAGIGFFAEDLSLQRMVMILEDRSTPHDLRQMFELIHYDEAFHVNALRAMAGEAGIAQVVDCHNDGLAALGLKISEREKRAE